MYLFESSISTRNNTDRQKKILVVDEECVDQKKRKWEWKPKSDGEVLNLYQSKRSKSSNYETTKEVAKVDVELHLETPFPADWKQLLDLQSRQNHFYNTTARRRRSQYSRQSWEIFPVPPQGSSTSPSTPILSLELELNLPDGSSRPVKTSKIGTQCGTDTDNPRTVGGTKAKSLSWVCLAKDEEQSEMMATVCMRCHMLVMLCKSSPCCPNCKFTHQICL